MSGQDGEDRSLDKTSFSEEDPGSEIARHNMVAGLAKTRAEKIKAELAIALKDYIIPAKCRFVDLSSITPEEVGRIIFEHPLSLKPLMALSVIGGRAFDKDLNIKNVDTYQPRLNELEAKEIGKYLLNLLPKEFLLETLVQVDRVQFIDKEKRKIKGRWEEDIRKMLTQETGFAFVKKMITVGKRYEIDAAYFKDSYLKYAVDVKVIGARRDIHKRSDEIINKSIAYKQFYPEGKFAAVIYYPFGPEDVIERLKRPTIDSIVFANTSQESIVMAVRKLMIDLGIQPSSRQSHIS